MFAEGAKVVYMVDGKPTTKGTLIRTSLSDYPWGFVPDRRKTVVRTFTEDGFEYMDKKYAGAKHIRLAAFILDTFFKI